jgi:hypothetical protein
MRPFGSRRSRRLAQRPCQRFVANSRFFAAAALVVVASVAVDVAAAFAAAAVAVESGRLVQGFLVPLGVFPVVPVHQGGAYALRCCLRHPRVISC